MQNDLGASDAHVVVIHVSGRAVTISYADVHRGRSRFLRDLLEAHRVVWTDTADGRDFEMCTGSYVADDQDALACCQCQ